MKKNRIALIVLSISLIILILITKSVFVNDVFRIIVMVLLMSVFTKILFNVSFKESIIIAFIAEIVEMIAELLCVVILAIVNNNINVLVDSTTPLLIINISVLLICIILMKMIQPIII